MAKPAKQILDPTKPLTWVIFLNTLVALMRRHNLQNPAVPLGEPDSTVGKRFRAAIIYVLSLIASGEAEEKRWFDIQQLVEFLQDNGFLGPRQQLARLLAQLQAEIPPGLHLTPASRLNGMARTFRAITGDMDIKPDDTAPRGGRVQTFAVKLIKFQISISNEECRQIQEALQRNGFNALDIELTGQLDEATVTGLRELMDLGSAVEDKTLEVSV